MSSVIPFPLLLFLSLSLCQKREHNRMANVYGEEDILSRFLSLFNSIALNNDCNCVKMAT